MHRQSNFLIYLLATTIVASFAGPIRSAAAQGVPRQLATGVLQTIPIDLDPRDTHSLPIRLTGVESTAWTPNTFAEDLTLDGQTRQVTLFRDPVWEYELSFLPLRQETVGIPDAQDELKDVNVWYLVVRVRNTGASMTYKDVQQGEGTGRVVKTLKLNEPVAPEKIKFNPRFVLEGWVENQTTGTYQPVSYPSVISPVALAQIQDIEDPNQRLLDTHQLGKANIPLAKTDADPGVWAVAIWDNIHPEIDYVSVKVSGLSNARRMTDPLTRASIAKTLQLNFWRPGDAIGQRQDDVSYGIPLVDDPNEQIRITQFYNLPGPQLRLYEVNETAKRDILVGEIAAAVDLQTFRSAMTDQLDRGGALPAALVESAQATGGQALAGAKVTRVIPGRKWTLESGEKRYVLKLEPQFWEPDFGKIRFIKTLDYLWIYR